MAWQKLFVLALTWQHSLLLCPLWLRVLSVLQLQYKHGSIWNGEVSASDFWVCWRNTLLVILRQSVFWGCQWISVPCQAAWGHGVCAHSVSRETRALLNPDPTRCIPGSGQASRAKGSFFLTVVLGHAAFHWHSRVLPLTFTVPQHSAPAAAAGDNEEIGANSKK